MNNVNVCNQRMPLLSILIPAYENAEGVIRIIKLIPPESSNLIEVLVSDDSSSMVVSEAIKLWNATEKINVNYFAHTPTGNAVDNWNFLLGAAEGQYVQFIHHDEWPLSTDYFPILLESIEDSIHDLFIVNCVLFESGRTRRHSSSNLKRLIMREKKYGLLLSRNVIGSPSNIVFRHDMEIEFDRNLKWNVDVEFFVRLCSSCASIFVFKSLSMASDLDHAYTITASIKTRLSSIQKSEFDYLYSVLKYEKPSLIESALLLLVHGIEQCFYKLRSVSSYK